MHYSFIILLQLPYRLHFGEDKTCHLWVLSGEMMGDFKGEEEVDGREEGGCKECPLSPFSPLSEMDLSLFFFLRYLALFHSRSRRLSL